MRRDATGSGVKGDGPEALGARTQWRAAVRGGKGLTLCDPIPEHHDLGEALGPR